LLHAQNWQKALGGHSIWISANIFVRVTGSRLPTFTLHMTIHAEDRCNFNPGQKDIAAKIPDEENGIFEITGLPNNTRRTRSIIIWNLGSAKPTDKSF
jgi:hypothetical protein